MAAVCDSGPITPARACLAPGEPEIAFAGYCNELGELFNPHDCPRRKHESNGLLDAIENSALSRPPLCPPETDATKLDGALTRLQRRCRDGKLGQVDRRSPRSMSYSHEGVASETINRLLHRDIICPRLRASRLAGRQHRPGEGVQPVTERRHSRIRTHGDVARLHTLASFGNLQAASQPGRDQRRTRCGRRQINSAGKSKAPNAPLLAGALPVSALLAAEDRETMIEI